MYPILICEQNYLKKLLKDSLCRLHIPLRRIFFFFFACTSQQTEEAHEDLAVIY